MNAADGGIGVLACGLVEVGSLGAKLSHGLDSQVAGVLDTAQVGQNLRSAGTV